MTTPDYSALREAAEKAEAVCSYMDADPREPFYYGLPGRLKGAWAVVTGKAHAVKWPELGELESAMTRGAGR